MGNPDTKLDVDDGGAEAASSAPSDTTSATETGNDTQPVVARGPSVKRDEDKSRAELAALMARYAEGDVQAYERLFAQLSPRIFGFHLRSVGQASVAEDLTQQTFLKLHVARRRYRPGSPVAPWLFAIAKNVQRDRFRKTQRSREHLTEEGDITSAPGHIPSTDDDRDFLMGKRLRQAVDKLPEGQRDVVVLHKFQGFSMEEVANILGIGLSATKVRAFRAYKVLRKLLQREAP